MSNDFKLFSKPQDYTTLFLFYKKKTCAKRKTNSFWVKLFACKKVCVNLVESRGFLDWLYKYGQT